MNRHPIRVGVLGLQPGRSWAALAHLPALRSLSRDFEVIAVANTTRASASAAAAVLGIPRAFEGIAEMAGCPEIDLIVITVKVPHHIEAVETAFRAGKHVYCEWPLGNGLPEAQRLHAIQLQSGRSGAVGMQATVAAAVLFVRDLVNQGYIGQVLSTTVAGTCMNWGGVVDQANAYTLDRASGASMLTISCAHAMSAVSFVLGEVSELSATLATRRAVAKIRETGAEIPMTVADQVLVSGVLTSGAPMSVHYRGDKPRGHGFSWEINGTDGTLQLLGAGGNAQFVELTVSGGRSGRPGLTQLPIPDRYQVAPSLGLLAGNVASVYRLLADDIRNGGQTAPSFERAVQLHRLLDAVERSGSTGDHIVLNSRQGQGDVHL